MLLVLLLPAAILCFGGEIGRLYLAIGTVSLILDWFIFYVPGFPRDRENLIKMLNTDATSREADEIMNFTKWQIFHVQWQSLGLWILTSWRWLKVFDPVYRETVGVAFLTTALSDPMLHARMQVISNSEKKFNINGGDQ